jgi:hypothetical protein
VVLCRYGARASRQRWPTIVFVTGNRPCWKDDALRRSSARRFQIRTITYSRRVHGTRVCRAQFR